MSVRLVAGAEQFLPLTAEAARELEASESLLLRLVEQRGVFDFFSALSGFRVRSLLYERPEDSPFKVVVEGGGVAEREEFLRRFGDLCKVVEVFVGSRLPQEFDGRAFDVSLLWTDDPTPRNACSWVSMGFRLTRITMRTALVRVVESGTVFLCLKDRFVLRHHCPER